MIPRESIYGPEVTGEEIAERNDQLFALSQSDSIAAAMNELGIPTEEAIVVTVVAGGSPADGIVKAGDQIVSVNGQQVTTPAQVGEEVRKGEVGDTVTLEVLRVEEPGAEPTPQTLEVVTAANPNPEDPDAPPQPYMGIVVGVAYEAPFDIEFGDSNVGGPSAGMMFSLGIIDMLTEGQLNGGKHVAGTGTIDPEGNVGPIGGIQQKLVGARDAGAELMLAPQDNCAEVVGNIPSGLDGRAGEHAGPGARHHRDVGRGPRGGVPPVRRRAGGRRALSTGRSRREPGMPPTDAACAGWPAPGRPLPDVRRWTARRAADYRKVASRASARPGTRSCPVSTESSASSGGAVRARGTAQAQDAHLLAVLGDGDDDAHVLRRRVLARDRGGVGAVGDGGLGLRGQHDALHHERRARRSPRGHSIRARNTSRSSSSGGAGCSNVVSAGPPSTTPSCAASAGCSARMWSVGTSANSSVGWSHPSAATCRSMSSAAASRSWASMPPVSQPSPPTPLPGSRTRGP